MSLPAALFASTELQSRDVALPDGSMHTFYFRELPAVEFRRFQIAEGSDDDEKRAASISRLIVASLCDPDGKPALDVKQAMMLKGSVANALLAAILEVNGFAEKKSNETLG